MHTYKSLLIFFIAILLLSSSCKEDPVTPADQTARLTLNFYHAVDGYKIEYDTMKYVNAAGNSYLINEIQYFISDVILYKDDGTQHLLDAWEDIHYVDTDLPETWRYELKDSIQPGNYDSISFTFGINEQKNQSLMFVNPPESNMFWPEFLGGGYHYLKLNGKWKDTGDTIRPYNFHMGIGQIYDPDSGEITGFLQNYFRVSLSPYIFSIGENENISLTVAMDVQQWFENPNVFDFNQWGGDIMQKQDAMEVAKENGQNVFSLIVAMPSGRHQINESNF